MSKLLVEQPYVPVKFRRPKHLTKFGFPAFPRTPFSPLREPKFCDMGKLHR